MTFADGETFTHGGTARTRYGDEVLAARRGRALAVAALGASSRDYWRPKGLSG